jgi:hypothetical protein
VEVLRSALDEKKGHKLLVAMTKKQAEFERDFLLRTEMFEAILGGLHSD